MRYSPSNHSYAASAYDDDMCLKPSLLLWLALLWLSRAITLPIMIGVGHIAGVNADALSLLRDYWSADQLIPAALAFPVFVACCRRVPAASGTIRWIWARGRHLLLLSAGVDMVLPLVIQLREVHLGHWEVSEQFSNAVTTAVGLYFFAYILLARRARDTFLDFPPAL